MLGLGRLFSSFRDLYKELNPATLNGAVDVIVVEQPDGSFVCSPFYVRFGKMGVLRSREKLVDITINEVSVDLHMKLAESGEAYFVEDTVEEHELPLHLATSPLPFNGEELMAEGLANLKRQVGALSDSELPQIASGSASSTNLSPSTSFPNDLVDPEKTPTIENIHQKTNSEILLQKTNGEIHDDVQPDKLSNSLPPDRRHLKKLTRLRRENEIFRQRSLHSRSASWHGGGSLPNLLTTPTSNGPVSILDKAKSTGQENGPSSSNAGQRRFRLSKSFVAQQQLHLDITEDLDEINGGELHPQLNSDPQKYANSDSTTNSRMNLDLPSDIAVSLCGGLDDKGESSLSEEIFRNKQLSYEQFNSNPDLLFSDDTVIRWNGKYYKYKVAIPILMSLFVFHRPLSDDIIKDLIGKYNVKPADKDNKTSQQATDAMHQTGQSSTTGYSYSSWFSWRRASSLEPSGIPKPSNSTAPNLREQNTSPAYVTSDKEDELSIELSDELKDAQDLAAMSFDDRGAMSDSELDQTFGRPTTSSRYRKSLYLNSDQIKMLNLKPNQGNRATFSVTTKYQGTSACECEIYLWKWYDKVVISDIDGTITKSDVLGHIMPIVGRQWEQSNVADLFTRIVDNGFRVMYLTARAIGQSQWTKDYLKSIKQDNKSLPDGPLQLAPTSLFSAFHREVIEKKPEVFKMKCLRDIKSLFPDSVNPFYAGFGNKITDEYAYRASGVPSNRIFTINPLGEVRFADKELRSSYQHISDLVDHIFPALPVLKHVEGDEAVTISTFPSASASEEFSSFSYWRQPLSNTDVDVSKFPLEKPQKSARKESIASMKKK